MNRDDFRVHVQVAGKNVINIECRKRRGSDRRTKRARRVSTITSFGSSDGQRVKGTDLPCSAAKI